MKIRITARDRIYGDQGEDMFDKVIDIESLDLIPRGWDAAYVVERAAKKEAAEPVTNPAAEPAAEPVVEPTKQTLDLKAKG